MTRNVWIDYGTQDHIYSEQEKALSSPTNYDYRQKTAKEPEGDSMVQYRNFAPVRKKVR